MLKNNFTQLHTVICDLFGCQYPVVLAGMGGVSRSALVTAVINAGGYGFLGMVREPPEKIEYEINEIRKKSNKDFGVNIIPAATEPALLKSQVNICIKEQVSSVCLFWDVYPEIIRQLKDSGIIVVHQVGTLKDAEAAQAAGVHVLIAQGIEAGGHVRGTLPLRKLLSRILRVSDLPVLAAGGIVNGEDLVELIIAGAHGIVIGTAFLVTKESFAHDYHKQCIINSKQDETILTDLFHINWPFGALTRVLPNSITKTTQTDSFKNYKNKTVIGTDDERPIYLFSTDSPLKSTTGNLESMAIYAGCGVYRINKIEFAADKLKTLINEALGILLQKYDIQPVRAENKSVYSSPCYLSNEDYECIGLSSNGEILKFLEELLAAERAGARTTIHSMLDCDNEEYRNLFKLIYFDESRWCKMLSDWIRQFGHEPSCDIGNFYYKAMDIENIEDRINYLNKGQAWVVKRLRSMLTSIDIVQLQEDLQDMLTSHVANIALAKNNLDVP